MLFYFFIIQKNITERKIEDKRLNLRRCLVNQVCLLFVDKNILPQSTKDCKSD